MIREIWEERDENGLVRFARVQTYGDTTHTFIELPPHYRGLFLPGYQLPKIKVLFQSQIKDKANFKLTSISDLSYTEQLSFSNQTQDCLLENLPQCGALYIDHIVGNQPDLTMEDAAKW